MRFAAEATFRVKTTHLLCCHSLKVVVRCDARQFRTNCPLAIRFRWSWVFQRVDRLRAPSVGALHAVADVCHAVRTDYLILTGFADQQQISRGKFDRLPYATAEFTTSALDGYGLRCHVAARPAPYASDPVLVHRLVRLLHASFRPRLARRPCASLSLHLHQVVKGTFTPELSNMLGTHEKRGGLRRPFLTTDYWVCCVT